MAKKIVIASGKGGVGKSTVTAGLSRALENEGKKVLAIDFDIGLRSLDLLFGVREQVVKNWGDVLLGNCEKEHAIIHVGNIDFISAPLNFNEEFTQEKVREMIGKYDEDYDIIFFDAPAGISAGFSLACVAADSALVVSTPDDVCVRSVEITAQKISSFGINDIRLVINRFIRKLSAKRKFLNVDEVIDLTSVQLIGVIPYDAKIGFSSMQTSSFNFKASSQKSFGRIAKRILGENVPLKL
ncbi:MAG: P-loop NTPase [Clostridia bacterium]|nr:P-loop NTPase [Clostridia bacterium]